MKKYLLFIYLIAVSPSFAQNYFSIQIDPFNGLPDGIAYMIPIEEGIITLNSHVCFNPIRECASYILYDYEGNILVKKLIPFIDTDFENIYFDKNEEEIIITGHENPQSNIFHLYKCNLNGDSLFHQIYEIFEASEHFVSSNSVTKFNGQYVIQGQAIVGEELGDIRAISLWIEEDGTLDTIIWQENYRYFTFEQEIDKNGLLTVMYEALDTVVASIGGYRRLGFFKFNENKEIVWEWESDWWFLDNKYQTFAITENNDIVFNYQPNEDFFDDEMAIARLTEEGEILWEHEFHDGPYKVTAIKELKIAANGDILGAGVLRDITEESQDGILHRVGYAFRFSPEGELLWERRYRDFTEDGELKWGQFEDIKELEDGNLIMGGRQFQGGPATSPSDAWLIFTDSEGCIEPNCEELIILDAKEAFFLPEEINIIQNPIEEEILLNINLSIPESLDYQILDAMGRTLVTGKTPYWNGMHHIDAKELNKGIYFLYIYNEEKRQTLKFVKN